MDKRGIGTRLGSKISGFSAQGVDTEMGHIPADLILFMPGMTGPAWARDSGLPLSEGGMIQRERDEFCQVASLERVFVAGDAGSLPGPG